MWVWKSLKYEHVAALPGGALGALGCRCRQVYSDAFTEELSAANFLQPPMMLPGSEALLDEHDDPLQLEDAEAASKSTKVGAAMGAWRLVLYNELRLCVPGAVELSPGPAPMVFSSGPERRRVYPAVRAALDRLVNQGGGSFWYRVPMVDCHLREDIENECRAHRASPGFPLCVVGAVIGAALRITVSVDVVIPGGPRPISPQSPLPAAPGSPSVASRQALEIQCNGFSLRVVQHGGPPVNPAKLHDASEEEVATELEKWGRKALANRPQTWRTLYAVTKEGTVEDLSRPAKTLSTMTGTMRTRFSLAQGAAFRGGRQLGDAVLAAAGEAEIYMEPFQLSYGAAHVNSLRAMLQQEIASAVGISTDMVLCGGFSGTAARGAPKKPHLRREVVTLQLALLSNEVAMVSNGKSVLPLMPRPPLLGGSAEGANAELQATIKIPLDFQEEDAAAGRTTWGATGRQGQTGQFTKSRTGLGLTLQDAARRTLQPPSDANQGDSSPLKAGPTLLRSPPKMDPLMRRAAMATGGLSKSQSEPTLGSPPKKGSLEDSEGNRHLPADQLLKHLITVLQNPQHPIRKHPDVFPMLSRISVNGLKLGAVLVASKDSSKGQSTESFLRQLLSNQSPAARQDGGGEEEYDAQGLQMMSTMRSSIMELYEKTAESNGTSLTTSTLLGTSEKELLEQMEAAYANKTNLRQVLHAMNEKASSGVTSCLRFRRHRAVERLIYTMWRFNSERTIVGVCYGIMEKLTLHDLGTVDEVIESSVVPELITAMQTFTRFRPLQLAGCKVLRRLYIRAREMALHGPRIVLIGRNLDEGPTFRGLDRIFEAMHVFVDDAEIQLESCHLLSSLGELICNNGMSEDVFKKIDVVMNRHKFHAGINAYGVLIISRLGEGFLRAEPRGVNKISEAMARHRSDKQMQRVGTQALFALSKRQDTLDLCRKGGGIGAVLHGMCAHSLDSQTTQNGTRVLEKLCPRALAKAFQVFGDVASVLPPLSWSPDPLVAGMPPKFEFGHAIDDGTWHPELVEKLNEMARPTRRASTSEDSWNYQRAGITSLECFRHRGLREDLDGTDHLWAVAGMPKTTVSGVKGHSQLEKDRETLKSLKCDERSLMAVGPNEEQLRGLCTALQDGLDRFNYSPQDAELLAGLLGHFAWQSTAEALKVIGYGGVKACVAWLTAPRFVSEARKAEEDALVFPMFRACLAALSSICRHGKQCATALLEVDGVALVTRYASHLDEEIRRPAIRCLARLIPHSPTIQPEDTWDLILRELRDKDESIRTAAAACALEAACLGWVCQGSPVEEFANALRWALAQATTSTSALPILLTVEQLVKAEDRAAVDMLQQTTGGMRGLTRRKTLQRMRTGAQPAISPSRTKSTRKPANEEEGSGGGQPGLAQQLVLWLPAGAVADPPAGDLAASVVAAAALQALSERGCLWPDTWAQTMHRVDSNMEKTERPLTQEKPSVLADGYPTPHKLHQHHAIRIDTSPYKLQVLETLLHIASTSEVDPILREACASALKFALVSADTEPELLAQLMAHFLEEVKAGGKRLGTLGSDALMHLAKRIKDLLKVSNDQAPDTLVAALDRAEPLIPSDLRDCVHVRRLLNDARNLIDFRQGQLDARSDSTDSLGRETTSPLAERERGSRVAVKA